MRKMKLLLSVWVCKKRRSRQKNVTVFSCLHFPCFLCRGFVFDLKFHNTHLSSGEEGNCCTESYHTFDPVLEKTSCSTSLWHKQAGPWPFFYFPFLYFLAEGRYLHTHTRTTVHSCDWHSSTRFNINLQIRTWWRWPHTTARSDWKPHVVLPDGKRLSGSDNIMVMDWLCWMHLWIWGVWGFSDSDPHTGKQTWTALQKRTRCQVTLVTRQPSAAWTTTR